MQVAEISSERADAQRNRAAILDVAAEVLAAEPNASLSEVAARAGLGRATIYRHFASREALLAAIRAEVLSRAGAALAALDLTEVSLREGVRQAASELVPIGMRFRILLAEQVDENSEFLAARARTLSPLGQLIHRGVATGELAAGTDVLWAGQVLAALLMTAVRAADLGVLDPARAADAVATTFCDGFAAG